MTRTTAKHIGRHVVALFSSTCVLGIIPILAYAVLVIWSGDLGGPLNLVIVPLLSGALGGAISVIAFFPLSLLAERFDFQRWLRFVGLSTVALTATAITGWIFTGVTKGTEGWAGSVSFLASLGLFLIGGFLVYLCSLAFFRRIFP